MSKEPGITKKMVFGDEEFDVPFAKGNPGRTKEELDALVQEAARIAAETGRPNDMEMVGTMGFCAPYNPRTYLTNIPHMVCQRDQTVTLRDGVHVNVDIYRPDNTTEKVPAICCFGPFGKNPSEGMDSWQLMGVPPKTVSEYAKFESADPGFWVPNGYAVVNVDPRGIGHSEGDVYLWGSQDAQDGADVIDWVGEQEWCNGKCSVLGNSGVCMTHWRIAAQRRQPHRAVHAGGHRQRTGQRSAISAPGCDTPAAEAGQRQTDTHRRRHGAFGQDAPQQ